MSEEERELEHDAAWLLARERGQPGPAVSDATAVRYARLQSMITDLPATPSGAGARAGWQQEVLAAIDAADAGATASSHQGAVRSVEGATPARVRHRSRRWVIPAAIFVSTAVVPIGLAVYRRGGDVEAPTIAYEVEPASAPQRGPDPSAGDTLIVRAVVEGPGELRIYNGAGLEQAHCSRPALDCSVERSGNRTTLRLTMQLRAPGPLRAVLFAAPLGGPSGGINADVDAAMRAGIARTPRDLLEIH